MTLDVRVVACSANANVVSLIFFRSSLRLAGFILRFSDSQIDFLLTKLECEQNFKHQLDTNWKEFSKSLRFSVF